MLEFEEMSKNEFDKVFKKERFEDEVYQHLNDIITKWNEENPSRIIKLKTNMPLSGVCSWRVDFHIKSNTGLIIVVIEVKETDSVNISTHKQHLDRAFVELYDLKFNCKDSKREKARYYLLLRGIILKAMHDYGALFQSIGIRVYYDEEFKEFESDLISHLDEVYKLSVP